MRDAILCGACEARFLVCGAIREILKCYIGHTLERAFLVFLSIFVVAKLFQEKGSFNTQEFTRFLSTGVITASNHAL